MLTLWLSTPQVGGTNLANSERRRWQFAAFILFTRTAGKN
jgi:hypothetical protein